MPTRRPSAGAPVAGKAGRPRRPLLRRVLGCVAVGCVMAAGLGLAACGSGRAPAAPPEGSITDDRALGDILVRFSPPDVNESMQAGELLAAATGPVRFVVKRPMSGGIWLVTAISADKTATLEQALTTLRALPRVQTAEPDRFQGPSRPQPTGRDMPAS
ncbi:hypothetical protein [Cupriavidus sp. AU9028]|uniref:hypothetical protein n=1 Tax=Cupriavidus sp. AU9028 TaxID=2871157 RepID=UPI001C93BA2F|nr:hypothetical protein [Cupriavidus sp. AU9028]MBY4895820.1 hypothetical protein [Cupriavidus sp. AU9028]